MTCKDDNPTVARHGSRKMIIAALFRNTAAWNVALIAVVVGMFVGYLMMNNTVAARGFEIRSSQQHIADLQGESERLDLKVVQLRSLGAIQSKVQELGLVPVGQVQYVGSGPSDVAFK